MKPTLMRLAQYTRWADGKVLSAVTDHDVDDEAIQRWLSHSLETLEYWLSKITTESPRTGYDTRNSKEALWRTHEELHDRFLAAVSRFSPVELDSSRVYEDQGRHFENRISDLLLHVIHHATHHRAQIVARLRQLGHTPPQTDYLVYLRETRRNHPPKK